jgi:hypothetical protein
MVLFVGLLPSRALPGVAASADEHFRFGPILFGIAMLVTAAKVGGPAGRTVELNLSVRRTAGLNHRG